MGFGGNLAPASYWRLEAALTGTLEACRYDVKRL